ncbi:hypothetical protein AAD018_004630 [Aestuariibius insulae]|uniref:hypothetical protein n=1 Tax=Aestuariibius insulae TaxID=2058287 RepID=UPI00345E78C9
MAQTATKDATPIKPAETNDKGDLNTQIELLQRDLGSLAETTLAQLDQLHTEGRARAKNLTDQTNEFVRSQPVTALAIVAGVGFLAGLMSRR